MQEVTLWWVPGAGDEGKGAWEARCETVDAVGDSPAAALEALAEKFADPVTPPGDVLEEPEQPPVPKISSSPAEPGPTSSPVAPIPVPPAPAALERTDEAQIDERAIGTTGSPVHPAGDGQADKPAATTSTSDDAAALEARKAELRAELAKLEGEGA